MNINELSAGREAANTKTAAPVNRTRPQPVAIADADASCDNVDMSMIGRIMARSVKDLANDDLPRTAKTEQFKDIAEKPLRLSDSMIDRILRRMVG